MKTPTWLSVKRDKTRSPEFHRKSLGEFKTSDELGRGIGLNFPGVVHNTVGEDMATVDFPLDPVSFPWHAYMIYLDDIWSTWETT